MISFTPADLERLLCGDNGEHIAWDFLLRIVAVDRPLQFVTPSLGQKHVFSAAKAHAVLGWKPRPTDTTQLSQAEAVAGTQPA
jgi:hypothetical protein